MNFTHRASIHTSFSFVSQSAILDWLENKSISTLIGFEGPMTSTSPPPANHFKSTAFRTLLRSYLDIAFFPASWRLSKTDFSDRDTQRETT